MVPAAPSLTFIFTVVASPSRRLPRSHTTFVPTAILPSLLQRPWLAVAETSSTPFGASLASLTAVATSGPLLVALSSYAKTLPTHPEVPSESFVVMLRSATGSSITVTRFTSLSGMDSNVASSPVSLLVPSGFTAVRMCQYPPECDSNEGGGCCGVSTRSPRVLIITRGKSDSRPTAARARTAALAQSALPKYAHSRPLKIHPSLRPLENRCLPRRTVLRSGLPVCRTQSLAIRIPLHTPTRTAGTR